jgi:hypothetical protein
MGFSFSGYVINGARAASSNATSTSLPVSGVLRDIKHLTGSSQKLEIENPPLVDLHGDQYRAAILESPVNGTTEYLIWAANTSHLSLGTGGSWIVVGGDNTIPIGTLSAIDGISYQHDGTNRLVIRDSGGRTLTGVESIRVYRGDVGISYLLAVADFEEVNPEANLVTIKDSTLIATFGGAFSNKRGDYIVEANYFVAPPRFWWTRNDPYETRFGWNNNTQRWSPYKGGSVVSLGTLSTSEHTLTPRPSGVTVGDFLPGSQVGDAYCMIRVGVSPNSASTPVAYQDPVPPGEFSGILVVTDEEATTDYNFSGTFLAGVVAVSEGALIFNPSFVSTYAGLDAWYSPRSFKPENTGIIGDLLGADTTPLFIAPIPEPGQYPFIRVGSRSHLSATVVDTEADLAGLVLLENEVGVALSTGMLLFSTDLVKKADPIDALFDIEYLGARLQYGGVAFSQQSQPPRQPVALTDDTGVPTLVSSLGVLYVPDADPRGPDGLGMSGILHVPDGTGAIPDLTNVPGVRPGGDTMAEVTSGLIRQVRPIRPSGESLGDVFVYGPAKALDTLTVEDRASDLPNLPFKIDGGTIHVAKQSSTVFPNPNGSKTALSTKEKAVFDDEFLYFAQSILTPSIYTNRPRVVSRIRDTFVLTGTEHLYFEINGGVVYDWSANTYFPGGGTFTTAEIATSFNTLLAGDPFAIAQDLNGFLVLESTAVAGGYVEIGFGTFDAVLGIGVRDISGCTALGILPGWRAVDGEDWWLPDSGVSFGLYRSPVNLDRTGTEADYYARYTVSDVTVSESVSGIPVVTFNQPPLQDVAGYDEGVFFQITTTIKKGISEVVYQKPLRNLVDVLYRFEENHFKWLDSYSGTTPIYRPTQTLHLGQNNVVLDTLYGVAPNPTGGIFIAESGGSFTFGQPNVDYLLEAATGNITLVESVGTLIGRGFGGSWAAGGTTLTNVFPTGVDGFVALGVAAGYRIKILTGDSAGSYEVQSVTDGDHLEVAPPFIEASGNFPVAWEVYEGIPTGTYNPAIVADVISQNFNHLPDEPFKIRVLSPLGTVPATEEAQVDLRLTADMAGALESGREINLRYGLSHGATATLSAALIARDTANLVALPIEELGTLANGSLFVPGAAATHAQHIRFDDAAFILKIGVTTYSPGLGTVVAVTTFSANPVAVEYLTTTGELKFNSDLLTNYESSTVRWEGTFLTAILLPARTVEYDKWGNLNICASDLAEFGGTTTAYFVEKMVTEGGLDVVINPINGGISFAKPLGEYKIVEAEYYQAGPDGTKKLDADGNDIFRLDFLPLYVRGQVCTRVSERKYSFNPADAAGFTRTIFTDLVPTTYRDTIMANFGVTNAEYDLVDSSVAFRDIVSVATVVKTSFAVLESFGGEQAYSTPVTPIYRPPFFIGSGASEFDLIGDRTGDVLPGMLLRLGPAPFYIKTGTYDANIDVTTIEFYPATVAEAGSRAPGKDVLTVLTDRPITSTVDAEHPVAITGADDGFMLTVTQDWEPADRGQANLVIDGNLLQWAVPGHIVEVGGCPHIIASASLNEEMTKTVINVTTPFLRGYRSYKDVVKLSVRPVYPPTPRDFIGIAPVYQSHPVELVLWGELDTNGNVLPGRTLIRGVEYDLDFTTGAISLIEPTQIPMLSGQTLALQYTKEKILAPIKSDGQVILPRVKAGFRYATTPTEENGFLGAFLQASYTFESPDSFYCRVATFASYAGQVASDILTSSKLTQGTTGGPIVPFLASPENYTAGAAGIDTKRTDLTDKDRAAIGFLDFYCQTVGAFEQIKETVTGEIVGDRNGKFRFFVGRDRMYAPPGYEDQFTGVLNPRSIFSEVFQAATEDWDVPVLFNDNIVDPSSAQLVNGSVLGRFMNGFSLDTLLNQQRGAIENDVDDIVMTSLGKVSKSWDPYPFLRFTAMGNYSPLYDPNEFSRIFPEISRGYLTTSPGIESDLASGDFGSYSFLRLVDWDWQRTWKTPIGQIGNPVIPAITDIRDVVVAKRMPRARIWGYFPTGIPADALGGGYPAAAINQPCVIATPLHLIDFPVNPETGWPDAAQLQAQNMTPPGEGVLDLTTGDPDLHLPPLYNPLFGLFSSRAQVAFGKPDGTMFAVGSPQQSFGGLLAQMSGAFVDEVLFGCIITFKTITPAGGVTPILSPAMLQQLETPSSGTILELEKGDTIYIIPPSGSAETTATPPTEDDYAKFTSSMPAYREGSDVGLKKKSGILIDKSLPGGDDPIPITGFNLQSWFGQSPPSPGEALQVDVEFSNSMTKPLLIPALAGLPTDDTGDYSIPYLGGNDTELIALGDAQMLVGEILTTVSFASPFPLPPPPDWSFVYPDEILANDGAIRTTLSTDISPAALLTTQIYNPTVASPLLVGVEDARPYDLLLVEMGTGTPELPEGSQGILSIGRVQRNGIDTYSMIEPPRFITQTDPGDPILYYLNNATSYIHDETEWDWSLGPPPVPVTQAGCRIVTETAGAAYTLLDMSTVVPQLVLDNGMGAGGVGGLNTFLAADPQNLIRISILAREVVGVAYPGDEILRIELRSVGASTVNWTTLTGAGAVGGVTITLGMNDILSENANFQTIKLLGFVFGFPAEIPSNVVGTVTESWDTAHGTPARFDYTISLSCVVAGESQTAFVENDRLTFKEVVDTRLSRPRGYRHPIGYQLWETQLNVESCTVQSGAAGSVASVINKWVNGPIAGTPYPLTFLLRDDTALDSTEGVTLGVGTWNSGAAGTEIGSVRVMGFEGWGPLNTVAATATATLVGGEITAFVVTGGGAGYVGGSVVVTLTDVGATGWGGQAEATVVGGVITAVVVKNPGHAYTGPITVAFTHIPGNYAIETDLATFSMVPSMAYDEVQLVAIPPDDGIICDGTGEIQHPIESIITNVDVTTGLGGSLEKVVPGDVVVIDEGATTVGTIKAGTYLVRHAIEPDSTKAGVVLLNDVVLGVTADAVAGASGWVDIQFPKIDTASVKKVNIVDSSVAADALFTTAVAHDLTVGDTVLIANHSEISLNGSFTVGTTPLTTTFTITMAGTGGTGGTAGRAIPAIDATNLTVRVDNIPVVAGAPLGGHSFPSSGRVYFITSLNGIASQTVSATYSAINTVVGSPLYGTFQLLANDGLGRFLDTDGVAIAIVDNQTAFWDLLSEGMTISGMLYFPVEMGGTDPALPDNNVVGFTDNTAAVTLAAYGFAGITITTGVTTQEFMYLPAYGAGTAYDIETAAGTAESIIIGTTAATASTSFVPALTTPVYANCPTLLRIDEFTDGTIVGATAWNVIRTNKGVSCFLPGDVLSTTATFTAGAATPVEPAVTLNGFWAKSGIFTEPSWPLPAQNLAADAAGDQRVVSDATPVVAAGEIGFRMGYDETVKFQVRRIRRFHDLQTDLESALSPLRFAYEIRRGRMTLYDPADPKQIGIVTAANFDFPADSPYYRGVLSYNGTQLGGFNDPDVNIWAGDTFRLLRVDMTEPHPRPVVLVEEAKILRVIDEDTLHLASPGLTDPQFLIDVAAASYTDYWFEIYLKRPIVPQEQSAEQLLDLLTDEVVTETRADYVNQEGGYVDDINTAGYDTAVNKLLDDTPGVASFIVRGVEEGDIILVDPASQLSGPGGLTTIPERGSRPFGDMSVIEREPQDVTFYDAGRPSTLDDNRGFYRVTEVAADALTVDGTTEFGGVRNNDVIFPTDVSAREEHGYAVYPTIHASLITDLDPLDTEGQVDLRPTMLAGLDDTGAPVGDPDSFVESNHSIRPFSYKVIRPSSLFSTEAADFILTNRERTLSLIEQFRAAISGSKGGSYFVFQRDDHIFDLGVLGVPESGLGLFSNSLLEDIIGQTLIVPFGSDYDALSILDRRFWGLDERLDHLTSDGTGFGVRTVVVGVDTAYTGYEDVTTVPPPSAVRPVLPDRVDIFLNTSDRFRALRNSWLTLRTNRKSGTLVAISRFDDEIPELKAQQLEYILQKDGLDDS